MSTWIERRGEVTPLPNPPRRKRQFIPQELIYLLARRIANPDHGMNGVSLFRWIEKDFPALLQHRPDVPPLHLESFRKAIRRAEKIRATVAPQDIISETTVAVVTPPQEEAVPNPETEALDLARLAGAMLKILSKNPEKKGVVRAVYDMVKSEV